MAFPQQTSILGQAPGYLLYIIETDCVAAEVVAHHLTY